VPSQRSGLVAEVSVGVVDCKITYHGRGWSWEVGSKELITVPEAVQRPAVYGTNSRVTVPELRLQKLPAGVDEAAACFCAAAMAAQRPVAWTAGSIGEGCDSDI
jgi:hypothetical protein